MLEPTAEHPRTLVDFHRRQAALNREAGDLEAALWHGKRAQRAFSDLKDMEARESRERGRRATISGSQALLMRTLDGSVLGAIEQ